MKGSTLSRYFLFWSRFSCPCAIFHSSVICKLDCLLCFIDFNRHFCFVILSMAFITWIGDLGFKSSCGYFPVD